MVTCYCVACFLWWLKGNFVWPCGVGCCLPILLHIVGLMGFTFSHISLALIVFAPYCILMSANSSTESISPSKSENGDNDNLRQISPASSSAKSTYSHSMGRGGSNHPWHQIDKGQISYAQVMKFSVGLAAYTSDSIPESRAHSALSPPISIPPSLIGNGKSPDLHADEPPFLRPPPSPPVEHIEELIALCLLGKSSPLKASLLPKVTIVEPLMTPQLLGSPPSYDTPDKDNSSPLMPPANLEDDIFLT
ncbi:hypothetical protein Cgig2_006285 [Carnegiea gigantea]|uniref:Uncharacterized protein n=1 Tax=Carnegiea gigantea TaxID=171969 RepID=A0A9Q1GMQ4_9CARY|nr:hypothetical protein Cgig2_006285 [Carnegiea gigantea]